MKDSLQRRDFYEDEIDLYELFMVLKKRKLYFLVFTLTFLIGGVLYCVFSPDIYRSSALVALPSVELHGGESKEIVDFSTTKSIVDLVNGMLEKGEYVKLSEELELPVETVRSLSSIEVTSAQRRGGKRVFVMKIDGRDKEVLPDILNSLIGYLNTNPFISRQIEGQRRILKLQLKELSRELPELEKEASLIKRRILSSQVKVVGFDPTSIDKNIIELREKKLNLEYTLSAGIHGYEVIYSAVTGRPVKPNRTLVLAVSLITGIFTGIFAAFFAEWLENARRRFSGAQQQ